MAESATASSTVFMITEQFFWPGRGGAEDQKQHFERMSRGFKHRQQYVESGKAQWFIKWDDTMQGILILTVSFEELQEFLQRDPFYGIVKREVVTLHDARHYSQQFESFIKGVDFKQRAVSPVISGDLSIASLAPDMRERLM